jgi:hypothetical protein
MPVRRLIRSPENMRGLTDPERAGIVELNDPPPKLAPNSAVPGLRARRITDRQAGDKWVGADDRANLGILAPASTSSAISATWKTRFGRTPVTQ